MRSKLGLPCLLALAVLSFLVAGCEGDKETPRPSLGGLTPTPDVQATVAALAETRGLGTPTPTPVSPQDRAVILNFARSHDSIMGDWEQYHSEFDNWREGLIECDASSLEVALRQFAASFSDITEEARALPRSSNTRELADRLIGAYRGGGDGYTAAQGQLEAGCTDGFRGSRHRSLRRLGPSEGDAG